MSDDRYALTRDGQHALMDAAAELLLGAEAQARHTWDEAWGNGLTPTVTLCTLMLAGDAQVLVKYAPLTGYSYFFTETSQGLAGQFESRDVCLLAIKERAL